MLCLSSLPPSMAMESPHLRADRPSPAKRPKLSLQTSSIVAGPHVFGASAAVVGPPRAAPPAFLTSPTLRNTFVNTYDAPSSSSCASPRSASSRSSSSPRVGRRPSSLFIFSSSDVPYTQPATVRSILRNSPLPSRLGLGGSRAGSPRTPRLRLFPLAKRVSFRSPIVAEIHLANDDGYSTAEDESEPNTTSSSSSTAVPEAIAFKNRRRRHPTLNGTPQPTPPASENGVGEDLSAQRRDRKRKWVWTLDEPAALQDVAER
ncbi:MAG: hypothetical protein M1832_006351 [Thelocarpon impressellum]|nr:MAG: hypothetical protein M1832_006351 [Thelocarpon impressellum]